MRVLGDLGPGVFVDAEAEIDEFASSLAVAGTLGVGGVASAAVDLDDDAVFLEQEVDAGDMASPFSMNDLSLRTR